MKHETGCQGFKDWPVVKVVLDEAHRDRIGTSGKIDEAAAFMAPDDEPNIIGSMLVVEDGVSIRILGASAYREFFGD